MIECPAIGTLKRLRIGHDNSGKLPGWFLDKVVVDDLKTKRVYEFPCGRWLAKDELDGRISLELRAGIFITLSFSFYRAMRVVLARYCYRKSSVCPSVCLSVCVVDVPWAYMLE